MQKKCFNRLLDKRMDDIQKISTKKNDFNSLTYHFKGSNIAPINFKFSGPLHNFEELKNSNISLQKVEEDQNNFKLNLGEITRGNTKRKSEDELKKIKIIKNLY